MKTQENTLIGQHEYPAISLLVPTHPEYPKFKLDKKHIQGLINQAEMQLTERFSKRRAGELTEKLKETVDTIDFGNLTQGIAIYVSPHQAKIVHLPFSVDEKVIVDDSFEVRDLLYSSQLHREYLLVLISKNSVRTAWGYGTALVPVRYKDMPENIKDVTNSHSLPGWDYLDTEAYDEKNMHNYLRFIDDVLSKATNGNDYPVIIMGDTKTLGLFKAGTGLGGKIIGYVDGNYEHATVKEIHAKINPILARLDKTAEDDALNVLYGSLSKGEYCAGLVEVWRAAMEGRGRLLLVEKGYQQTATLGDDAATLILGEDPVHAYRKIADAVDDVMETVLQKGGKVQFVQDGRLDAYERIALVTRY